MKKRKEISDILKANEAIARKFLKIESILPNILNVKELFETIVIQLEEEFHIPFVWISIINKDETADLIKILSASKILEERLNTTDQATFLNLVSHSTTPVLVNDDLKPFYRLLPQNRKFFIRSLAVAPITLNDEIIGSFNHGDFSHLRYQPGMDTSLLQKLTSHISAILSHLMKRKNPLSPVS
ncbi:MAG: hypothetical protein FJ139_11085 [Deltaproteobacteria bacterium]|nr:hypothetical protein [Deltaproteobacteria bacterium]